MRRTHLVSVVVAAVAALGLSSAQACAEPIPIDTGSLGTGSLGTGSLDGGEQPPVEPLPALVATPVLEGLDHPWDVVQAPDGAILTGQRSGGFVVRRADGSTGPVAADLTDLFAQSETGLMGIALARDFSSSRTLYTCQGFQGGGVTDVRVVSWTVDSGWTQLTKGDTVVSGMPVSNGRHGGCRILVSEDGSLFVGTGDAAQPLAPQDPASLGGKVLHVNPDGTPAAGNPDPASVVYSLGHRNVQGLAVQPGTGRLYGIEQGTNVDDEVNLLVPGGNYGYRPDRIPGIYDESVPMTDPIRVPGAIGAVWSSGSPTLATASGTFVTGDQWGDWDGALVIGGQKSRQLLFLRLSEDGQTTVARADGLKNEFGRIRSVTPAPDGSLLITTDNGDTDQVLRVVPQG
ncbi:PQQ-dependent sugar dehydrogenase [Rhodococcus triatomae]|uniref:Glucose/arabinose dehydrogenase, beta-propeller fold n=1 Tax=Rhodococcus triatomae TaxID=300028 RepID=A0A1G7ZZX1_9NOCA|nr:PQQ-dependent sugar dehydrogenase [Rhodococcus triatomae]QNG17897.1 PQQ-dependent sugar dehydrogenase [Rhodococcus triatomae]QNG22435.1 PQQ-dependent sugar dehydrogenase [Rhodococcus triatomae]SDH14216.1 Glucose/arabinose dehydrogenase, beta-propeller fold [Rhodococcus triatomae]